MLENLLPLFSIAFAILGTMARYAQSIIDDENQDISLKKFLLHLIISLFASILVILVGYTYHWSYLVITSFSGLAGWLGSKSITIIKNAMIEFWKH